MPRPQVLTPAERDHQKLQRATVLSEALATADNISVIMPAILEQLMQLFGGERGFIMLSNGRTLVPSVSRIKSASSQGERIVPSTTILAEVSRQRRALRSADATMDARFVGSSSVIMQGVRAVMCAPLVHGDVLLGAVYLDSQLDTEVWSDGDLALFDILARQFALAMHCGFTQVRLDAETRRCSQLERYVSPRLSAQLKAGPAEAVRVATLREVTMLFCGLCGFTALSETMEPTAVFALLNEYFELMAPILARWQGTLDKYVGDQIIALFESPAGSAPTQAVQCALQMQSALRTFHRARTDAPLQLAICIHTAPVACGAVGAPQSLQYTVVGDGVNTAARLCGLAKPGQILISEATLAAVAGNVQVLPMPPVKLKGKEQTLQIYGVLGYDASAAPPIPSV